MPARQLQGSPDIKGILFDVDGTLYHQAPLRAIMMLLLVLFNLYKPKELKRKVKVILQYRRSQEILRESPPAEFPEMQTGNQNRQLLMTAGHTGETVSYISRVIDEWFEKRPLPFLPLCGRRKLKESIAILHKKGITLGVFSDYPAEKKLEALGVSRFITTVVTSRDQEVYGFKPKTNGFKIAAARMGLKPSEILYIGDRSEVDGLGGSEAGMQVVILGGFFKRRNSCDYPSIRSFSELSRTVG
jgi:FMN phosphatase YigB (HAD superfamily)